MIDEIYSKMKDKMALIERLAEMYNEPIKAMLDEPEEGNVEWTPSW